MKTSDSTLQSSNHEQPARVASGWMGLVVNVALYAAAPLLIFVGARSHVPLLMFVGGGALIAAVGLSCGFFTLQPNEGMVLILFGAYKGTVRDSGFWVVNPFCKRIKISLRTRNFNSDKIKVNE